MLTVKTRLRPGVYWDEHNFERRCVVMELNFGGDGWKRLSVLDAVSGEPLADPPAAITITREEP